MQIKSNQPINAHSLQSLYDDFQRNRLTITEYMILPLIPQIRNNSRRGLRAASLHSISNKEEFHVILVSRSRSRLDDYRLLINNMLLNPNAPFSIRKNKNFKRRKLLLQRPSHLLRQRLIRTPAKNLHVLL